MLEDELLQEQECPLVRDLLTKLYYSLPCILCGQFCTIWTLAVLHYIFHLEDLLDYRRCEDLL